MLRLVHSPQYGWGVDAKGDLPGRAWWITPSAELILHHAVIALQAEPEELIALLDWHLLERVQSTLSRARRAGQTCIGGMRITQWLQENPDSSGILLLRAYDGGSGKMWTCFAAQGRLPDDSSLSQTELGSSFQRAKLGSVLVKKSGFCGVLRNECQKLSRLRHG
ncbi:MAG: hypothetical protein HRT36_03355 [Alphaproteobacteria bacterium]|nr:hypothetical protein [Alphaproteobacteria bacterium]